MWKGLIVQTFSNTIMLVIVISVGTFYAIFCKRMGALCAILFIVLLSSVDSFRFRLKDAKMLQLSLNRNAREICSPSKDNSNVPMGKRTKLFVISENLKANDAVKNSMAKAIGYVMGAGAMFIYSPILLNLIRKKSAEGYAISTWIYNVFGLALATAYPAKKGFPLSTYVELIAATVQSVFILLLIAYYQGQLVPIGALLTCISIGMIFLLRLRSISPTVLGWIQISSSIIANYANFPQIILSFQTKKAAWSGITALMSMTGCFIRILTTLQLTKDPIVIGGYLLGFITNSILFSQVLFYGKN